MLRPTVEELKYAASSFSGSFRASGCENGLSSLELEAKGSYGMAGNLSPQYHGLVRSQLSITSGPSLV